MEAKFRYLSNISSTDAKPLCYLIRFMFKDGLPQTWGKKL